jgi:AcrR family transcriptional regulator
MTAEERREQLLDVTKELVGEAGFHGVTIEGVAKRAGISRPIVYGHFESLQNLLHAMVERESARALSQLGEVLPAEVPEDPREALLAALRGYLETVRADPVTWRLVLVPSESAPEFLREFVTSGRDAVVAALADVLRPGLAPGRKSPDPQLTARMISAIADENARLLLTDPDEYPIDRLVEHTRWMLEQMPAV